LQLRAVREDESLRQSAKREFVTNPAHRAPHCTRRFKLPWFCLTGCCSMVILDFCTGGRFGLTGMWLVQLQAVLSEHPGEISHPGHHMSSFHALTQVRLIPVSTPKRGNFTYDVWCACGTSFERFNALTPHRSHVTTGFQRVPHGRQQQSPAIPPLCSTGTHPEGCFLLRVWITASRDATAVQELHATRPVPNTQADLAQRRR